MPQLKNHRWEKVETPNHNQVHPYSFSPMKVTTTYLTLLQTNCYHYQAKQLCFYVFKQFWQLLRNFTAGEELHLNGATFIEFCSVPLLHLLPDLNNGPSCQLHISYSQACPGSVIQPSSAQSSQLPIVYHHCFV